jgi:hypothetical protein
MEISHWIQYCITLILGGSNEHCKLFETKKVQSRCCLQCPIHTLGMASFLFCHILLQVCALGWCGIFSVVHVLCCPLQVWSKPKCPSFLWTHSIPPTDVTPPQYFAPAPCTVLMSTFSWFTTPSHRCKSERFHVDFRKANAITCV